MVRSRDRHVGHERVEECANALALEAWNLGVCPGWSPSGGSVLQRVLVVSVVTLVLPGQLKDLQSSHVLISFCSAASSANAWLLCVDAEEHEERADPPKPPGVLVTIDIHIAFVCV